MASNDADNSPEQSEKGGMSLEELPRDSIDVATFEQILEMDDDEDEREFSKSIVYGFFEQAEQTFKELDEALEKKDLVQLSSLGHFLKGSSATLGLTKVKDSCAKIQHYGQMKNEAGTEDEPDKVLCLARTKTAIEDVKKEYAEVEIVLKKFFGAEA